MSPDDRESSWWRDNDADDSTADETHFREAVEGLERRIRQVLSAHSDDPRYWANAMQQALRWLEQHRQRNANRTE